MVGVGMDGHGDSTTVGGGGDPFHAGADLVLKPVLGESDQSLGGQSDVANVLDLEQLGEEVLQPRPRHVGDIAATHDDIAHRRRTPQVIHHVAESIGRLAGELQLLDHRGGVSNQVHPGAVTAVLRTRGQQLGQNLGGVPVGEPLRHPHVVLVQRVPRRQRVGRPVSAAIREHRDHVVPDRVRIERVGQRTGAGGDLVSASSCSSSAVARASTSWPARPDHALGRRRSSRRPGRPSVRAAAECSSHSGRAATGPSANPRR